jgi:hypothetical protein
MAGRDVIFYAPDTEEAAMWIGGK